jgi:hypothetical protein
MNTDTAAAARNDVESSLGNDFLRGVKSIAEFLGENERRAFYLCEMGYIPCGKIGCTWVASKTALRRHFEELTRGVAKTDKPAPPSVTPRRRHRPRATARLTAPSP